MVNLQNNSVSAEFTESELPVSRVKRMSVEIGISTLEEINEADVPLPFSDTGTPAILVTFD
jgi:hypothetical protein